MASLANSIDFEAVALTNRAANRVLSTDQAAHRWYRFVLSFPPHLVRDYLNRFDCGRQSRILDPFAGTGTTLVEAKKLGVKSVGIEALPMAHFASTVKLNWTPDPDQLLHAAKSIADITSKQLDREGLLDTGDEPTPADLQPLSFEKEEHSLLLTDSISPLPLHKTLRLRNTIERHPDAGLRDHLLLALAKSTVSNASNLHFGPEVGIRAIKKDRRVIEPWLKEVRCMATDLLDLAQYAGSASKVYRFDARKSLDGFIADRSIDAVITSPPYPNEKDYTRTTRLESVLLRLVSTKEQLRGMKKQLVRSNTRSVYMADTDDAWVKDIVEIQEIASLIESRRIEMGKTSGFERQYARVTRLYFGGMARHLVELKRVLKPGAYLAYVVGDQASYLRVMIRTGEILARLAETLGYEVISIDLFRTRISTATKEQLREEVVVLRAPR